MAHAPFLLAQPAIGLVGLPPGLLAATARLLDAACRSCPVVEPLANSLGRSLGDAHTLSLNASRHQGCQDPGVEAATSQNTQSCGRAVRSSSASDVACCFPGWPLPQPHQPALVETSGGPTLPRCRPVRIPGHAAAGLKPGLPFHRPPWCDGDLPQPASSFAASYSTTTTTTVTTITSGNPCERTPVRGAPAAAWDSPGVLPSRQRVGQWGGGNLAAPRAGPMAVAVGSQVHVPVRGYQMMTAALREDIQTAAHKKQTGVSLKYLLDFGTQPLDRQMLLSARFLHAEFPIRLAHRLMDLNALPPQLSEEPHVRRVKGWYAESFSDFRSFPAIKDNADTVRFTAMLRNAFRRHNNVVPAIAKGVEEYKKELKRTGESSEERESEIQHFLDTFFLSRIAIRFLAGHHISMFEPPRPDHIGLVDTRCSPFQVASDAVSAARHMCHREYGSAPQVTLHGNRDLTMAYVPPHLHHMVFELVKNSLRAVQDRYGEGDKEPPAIKVVVAEGLEDVTIKVSDMGGGIPRSGLQRIWTYLYTTARSPLPEVDIDTSNMPAVLAGYGCGLPLSRLYARYFGGDLQIISMEGYGTDAYLHLARLGNDEEPLPGAFWRRSGK